MLLLPKKKHVTDDKTEAFFSVFQLNKYGRVLNRRTLTLEEDVATRSMESVHEGIRKKDAVVKAAGSLTGEGADAWLKRKTLTRKRHWKRDMVGKTAQLKLCEKPVQQDRQTCFLSVSALTGYRSC